ncbi:hypothetical protein TNCT_316521 [Trichonephila clavata]|uniref:Uncharacterized protein n=1 Tax=Trichonephila clavata TaxID=2740835 RepID=A0A8X6M401_TRICU|nr:hypothetical protein TNCT_316521 [Trichonephila clavata]
MSSDEFHNNAFRGGRRERGYPSKDRNDLSRYYGPTNFVTHQNEDVVNKNMVLDVNGVEFPIDGKGDKPQQSNSRAVLASPSLKFSDYEVFENGDDNETVNNIPVSFPQNSNT